MSSVTFTINERVNRVNMWLEASFSTPAKAEVRRPARLAQQPSRGRDSMHVRAGICRSNDTHRSCAEMPEMLAPALVLSSRVSPALQCTASMSAWTVGTDRIRPRWYQTRNLEACSRATTIQVDGRACCREQNACMSACSVRMQEVYLPLKICMHIRDVCRYALSMSWFLQLVGRVRTCTVSLLPNTRTVKCRNAVSFLQLSGGHHQHDVCVVARREAALDLHGP